MDTFDVIVGAIIGLVVSLITNVVAHLFETTRNKQARNWQIEDRQAVIRFDLIKERTNQIENKVNEFREFAVSIIANEEMRVLLSNKNVDTEDVKKIITREDQSDLVNIFSLLRSNSLENGLEDENAIFEISNKIVEMEKMAFEILKFSSFVLSLKDLKLIEDFDRFYNLIVNEIKNIRRLISLIDKGKDIEIKDEYLRIQEFLRNLYHAHANLISDLDKRRTTSV